MFFLYNLKKDKYIWYGCVHKASTVVYFVMKNNMRGFFVKKLKGFLIGLVLAIITVFIIVPIHIRTIHDYYSVPDNRVRYNTSYFKYKSRKILEANIDSNTHLLLGSSELSVASNKDFHPSQMFNYDDFHLMEVGGGYFQNIIHAATLASLEPLMPEKKVAIIESLTWFDQTGMRKDAFESRISKEHVYYTLINPKLTKETKLKFINRVIELSSKNASLKNSFERYKKVLVEGEGSELDRIIIKFELEKYSLDMIQSFYAEHSVKDKPSKGEKMPDYNWDEVLSSNEKNAKLSTSTNEYHFDDWYYKKNIQGKLDSLKNSASTFKYTESPEYEDFKLFLQMAKELGMDILVVTFPVNGPWYDYIGIDSYQRETFAKKVNEIVKESGVKQVDLTQHDYDPYYIWDATHPGWKGWPLVEKELVQFFK